MPDYFRQRRASPDSPFPSNPLTNHGRRLTSRSPLESSGAGKLIPHRNIAGQTISKLKNIFSPLERPPLRLADKFARSLPVR